MNAEGAVALNHAAGTTSRWGPSQPWPRGRRLSAVDRLGLSSWPVYKRTWTPEGAGPHCSPSGPGTAVVLCLVRSIHEVDEYNLSGGP
ncbi:hypothetical protein ACFQZC_19970 [Streptacidiphilus monticola]